MVLNDGFGRKGLSGPLVLPRLGQTGIEVVQMVGPQLGQLDVADFFVDADGQRLVAVDGGVLGAPLLFQIDDVVTVIGEGLAGIVDKPPLELVLQGGGVGLRLFSRTLLAPCRLDLKSSGEGLELFAVPPPAPVDTNGIGYEPAVFVPALLQIGH